jgi:hypothetical protein
MTGLWLSPGTPGGPGTVYVQTDVGDDSWKELWIDNLNRGDVNSCDYPTDIDRFYLLS